MMFVCSCGISFPTSEDRFPIFCRCGAVAETSDSELVTPDGIVTPRRPRDGCVNLRAKIRLDECPTCCGKVRVKVFGCTIHGECTISKPLPGIACCRGCWSFEQQQDEPN